MKKLFYDKHGNLVCPYCGEIPYHNSSEYFCPDCKKSFGLVTFKEIEEKKDRKPRPIIFA